MRKPLTVDGPARSEDLFRLDHQMTLIGRGENIGRFLDDDGGDLMCVRDLRGKFVALSPSWTTKLGFSIDALRGAPLLDLVHPKDVWSTHDVMGGIGATGLVSGFANRYRRQDGAYRRFIWTARLWGDRVFGLGRDVTDARA